MAQQVVKNFNELADAVADMSIDTIFFGADIELESPITIPANKQSLIFDGTHEDVRYRLTDMNSDQPTDTLRIGGASNISLTFQNMNMTGRNYYGIPYIYGIGTSGVTVTYRDIIYVGPQLVYNTLGLTQFENCDITISPSAISRAEEVGEVNRVEFAGVNTVQHNAATGSLYSVFWFRNANTVFRLLPDASLTVDTANYFMYSASVTVPYDIQQGASFSLHSYRGFSYDLSSRVASFYVGKDASFRYIQDAPNVIASISYASLYINGSFTADVGASVYMQADFDGAQQLLFFPLEGSGDILNITEPRSFALYNRTAAPIYVADTALTPRTFTIIAEQLNHWTSARAFPEAGSFVDIAQYRWHNANWAIFSVSGNVIYNSTSTNSTGLVNPSQPITSFSFQTARVISAGNLLILPDPVIDNGRPITGLTEPNAKLIISFTVGDEDHTFDDITAGLDGRFLLNPKMPIPIGTMISISANTPFLIKTVETTVVSTGEVTIIEAPERIMFKNPPISTNPVLLRRFDPEEPVKVDDSRPYPTEWKLLASITGPLRAASGEVLEGAVVYKDGNGNLWDLGGEPIAVYTGGLVKGETDVFWTEDKGILVRVTQPIRSGAKYSTQLIWALEVIDEP